jgi:hypothetical protein
MNATKLWKDVREIVALARLGLWLKWIRLTRRSGLKHTTITIQPENIVLKSWEPGRKEITTNLDGNVVEWTHSQWTGKAYFPFLEEKLDFTLSVSAARPTDQQIDFLRTLLNQKTSIRHACLVEIFNHYNTYVRQMDFSNFEGEDITNEVAPHLDSPAQMSRLLDTPSLLLGDDDVADRRFHLTFPCTWEPVGAGINVTVEDWRVVRVD